MIDDIRPTIDLQTIILAIFKHVLPPSLVHKNTGTQTQVERRYQQSRYTYLRCGGVSKSTLESYSIWSGS